jgi:hypothetical protein
VLENIRFDIKPVACAERLRDAGQSAVFRHDEPIRRGGGPYYQWVQKQVSA